MKSVFAKQKNRKTFGGGRGPHYPHRSPSAAYTGFSDDKLDSLRYTLEDSELELPAAAALLILVDKLVTLSFLRCFDTVGFVI